MKIFNPYLDAAMMFTAIAESNRPSWEDYTKRGNGYKKTDLTKKQLKAKKKSKEARKARRKQRN